LPILAHIIKVGQEKLSGGKARDANNGAKTARAKR